MSDQTMPTRGVPDVPSWVPTPVRRYLAHTEAGQSIRALARSSGCHASTVLRQIRRFENRRDDLLVDEALRKLGYVHFHSQRGSQTTECAPMTIKETPSNAAPDEMTLRSESLRILRRLCETGALLAVATDMDTAVVVRDSRDGGSTRTATVDREIAQAMALKDWITCRASGRVSRYIITSAGRLALNRMLAEAENCASGLREDGGNAVTTSVEEKGRMRRVRYNLAESPLSALARRRDRDGTPFLSDQLVRAGERLREDFELAGMAQKPASDWETAFTGGGIKPAGQQNNAARDRVMAALSDLGPGLGDAVLRCCCYLEGLEIAEKRLGWSARSGKIVLRIALHRLNRHYDQLGDAGKLIG